MRTKLIVAALAGAFTLGTTFAANAMTEADYKAGKSRLEADYKVAKERCKDMAGNAKDICQAEVKGDHEIAAKQLEADYKPTDKHQYDLRLAKAEATYKVAKEKCDDLKGNEKDVCAAEAKARYTKSKADAKVAKTVATQAHDPSTTLVSKESKAPEKIADAQRSAIDDKKDADYKVAKEKCDALSGQSKDNCIAEAKLKYGK